MRLTDRGLAKRIMLEDARHQPLRWSAQDEVDETRIRTILHRGVPPAAAALVVELTRLASVSWKDASGPVPTGLPIDEDIFERQGSYFRRTGTGVVDWFGWSRLLQEIGYTGCTLLELDAAEDPVFEMTQARDFVTTALSRFYTAG